MTTTTRRSVLLSLGALPFASLAQSPAKVLVEVWKDPTCGCCKDWVRHLEEFGFAVKVSESGRNAMRQKLGIPERLASCHTALVGGYGIEGHVPAPAIRKLLKEKPAAIALVVPGMPVGSPGMDDPVAYKGRRDPYDALLVMKNGETRVFASYNKA